MATKGANPARREKKGVARSDNRSSNTASDVAPAPAFPELPARKSAPLPCVTVTPSERAQLRAWVSARTTPHRLVIRSRIVLLASAGLPAAEIAARLGVAKATVRLWCERFHRAGVAALPNDAPGRGRRPGMSPAVVDAVLRAMEEQPAGSPAWSARTLAVRARVSASTVWRVWKRTRLGPSSTAADAARVRAQLFSETLLARK
jgi:transposase